MKVASRGHDDQTEREEDLETEHLVDCRSDLIKSMRKAIGIEAEKRDIRGSMSVVRESEQVDGPGGVVSLELGRWALRCRSGGAQGGDAMRLN